MRHSVLHKRDFKKPNKIFQDKFKATDKYPTYFEFLIEMLKKFWSMRVGHSGPINVKIHHVGHLSENNQPVIRRHIE